MSQTDLPPGPKFTLGRCCITPNALSHLAQDEILRALQRHQTGDWGDVNKHDHDENERSLREGFRLLSIYRSGAGVKFYVLTEADRSLTTVLLPEDY